MEKDQEQKHRCKVCRKCFPCGRSLGGHMRSHVPVNPLDADERLPQSGRSLMGFGAGYGLRENPKKTARLHDLGGPPSPRRCEECGKEFPSWKALFGHMRCHSVRPYRGLKEGEEQEQEEQEGSWSGGSQSDTEVAAAAAMVPRRRRRSRRMVAIPAPSSPASAYRLELEDVAISLMMLSRDAGFWGGAHSVAAESSDKNSVVLEDKGMAEEGEGDFVSDGREIWKAKKLGMETKGSESSVLKFEDSDEESGRGSSKQRNLNCGPDELGKKPGFNQSDSRPRSSKRDRIDAYDSKFGRNYVGRFGFDAPNGASGNALQRRSRYVCTTCNKTFHSYQALGGHRASHKRLKCGGGGFGSSINGSENSVDTEASIERAAFKDMNDPSPGKEASNGSSRKIKGHECVICGKVFPSGQALGGHKRSHLVGRAEATSQTITIRRDPPVVPDLLDLNLPAPGDGDSTSTNENSEFKSWWARSDLEHEPVMGMISN